MSDDIPGKVNAGSAGAVCKERVSLKLNPLLLRCRYV
jgi:hypothetical protein